MLFRAIIILSYLLSYIFNPICFYGVKTPVFIYVYCEFRNRSFPNRCFKLLRAGDEVVTV